MDDSTIAFTTCLVITGSSIDKKKRVRAQRHIFISTTSGVENNVTSTTSSSGSVLDDAQRDIKRLDINSGHGQGLAVSTERPTPASVSLCKTVWSFHREQKLSFLQLVSIYDDS